MGRPVRRAARMTGPLGDLRVVECSQGIAGAYAAKLFADAGAEVIVVEPPDGHPLRRWSPADREVVDGPVWQWLAASKRSVTSLDGLDPDVVIVDEQSGTYLPDAPVVVSITPFGRTAPWAGRPATEFTVQAECGSLGARGRKDAEPVQAGGRIAEWVGGAYGAAAGLAAARHAIETGARAVIDVSLMEVMCIFTGLFTDLMMSLLDRPQLPQPPRVIEFPSIAPSSDGWVGFNTNAAQMFDDFLVLIGQPEYVGKAMIRMDPTVQPILEQAMAEWTRAHTTDQVVEEASLFRIPAAPAGNGANLPDQEHLAARGFYRNGRPQPPYMIDGRRPGVADATGPRPGEHEGHIPARPTRTPAHPDRAGSPPMAGLKVLDHRGRPRPIRV